MVLPYDLIIKDVFPENVKIVTDFAKKTGDYSSLSATDIKVMALTYQLEKELVGISHINEEPKVKKTINFNKTTKQPMESKADIAGFYLPGKQEEQLIDKTENHEESIDKIQEVKDLVHKTKENEETTNVKDDDTQSEGQTDEEHSEEENVEDHVDLESIDQDLTEKFANVGLESTAIECDEIDVLAKVSDDSTSEYEEEEDDDDDESSWITPSNIKTVKKQINSGCTEEKNVKVACITTDFAMQNVLKQMNLQISALDGRVIKEVRTFILRCYACFGLTSIMTKKFCPKCGNDTLKKVAVSVDENGKQQIHINARRPLTSRGKKYSLPTFKGGKHSNNPVLVEDQPQPHQRPTRLARTKNNPMDADYIAGYSPFVMRDVNSKSAQLCIRPGQEMKHWMRKNPNESRRRKK